MMAVNGKKEEIKPNRIEQLHNHSTDSIDSAD